jgi:hypothetical protein
MPSFGGLDFDPRFAYRASQLNNILDAFPISEPGNEQCWQWFRSLKVELMAFISNVDHWKGIPTETHCDLLLDQVRNQITWRYKAFEPIQTTK